MLLKKIYRKLEEIISLIRLLSSDMHIIHTHLAEDNPFPTNFSSAKYGDLVIIKNKKNGELIAKGMLLKYGIKKEYSLNAGFNEYSIKKYLVIKDLLFKENDVFEFDNNSFSNSTLEIILYHPRETMLL